MSDEGGPRPGEPSEAAPVLRYSRARRLEKAPESVRWLSSRYGAKPPGIFRSLLGSRGNRLLFFTIVALILSFNLVPLLFGSRSSGRLAGDRYSAKAFWFEDRALVSIARAEGEGAGVDREAEGFILAVTALAEGGEGRPGARAAASFAAGLSPKEDFRLAVECPGGKPSAIALVVERGKEALQLELPVE